VHPESRGLAANTVNHEVRVCGILRYVSRRLVHLGPSKIAASASASRMSPTEAEIRTACLRGWRDWLGR
jgi:hypothetical protein